MGRRTSGGVELFTLLQELPLAEKPPCYIPNEQIKLVKHLREHIISGSSGYPGVGQFALDYGISVTQLQKVFRRVYGMPVYTYLREYRLEQAALVLEKTDESITSVAFAADFTNPGKVCYYRLQSKWGNKRRCGARRYCRAGGRKHCGKLQL